MPVFRVLGPLEVADEGEALALGGQKQRALLAPAPQRPFSPDSRRIVTAGADGAIRIYRCDTCGTPAQLEGLAHRRLVQLGRSLSPAERAKYRDQG